MNDCLFVSDLHGRAGRLIALGEAIRHHNPAAVFIGGDLLPPPWRGQGDAPFDSFINSVFAPTFQEVLSELGDAYPKVFLILGNDDPQFVEDEIAATGRTGLWQYAHGQQLAWNDWRVFGYAYVPPTPFRLKDWERYDVSRYVDPGCVSPEEGAHTVAADPHAWRHSTIASDLAALAPAGPLDRTIWLFHSPPYHTALDRAALDGRLVDDVPVDVHVGSIAIRRFIEDRQPPITLHGHVHESARLTGRWKDQIGGTVMLSAAHDGPELALVSFSREHPELARRELIEAVGTV